MAKRKVQDGEIEGAAVSQRRSARQKTSEEKPAAAPEPPPKTVKRVKSQVMKASKTVRSKVNDEEPSKPSKTSKSSVAPTVSENGLADATESTVAQQYWLMKAEPESRLENGHDIKFSIDDLAAKTEPEPWDGIRAYAARNNLRAMKKGDLAFFYHSSCKVPAIVGIMEVVKEHSPDMSAQDPKAPYFDPKDVDPSNPRWSVVHVKFRQKLQNPITLKELRDFPELNSMQMLKQSRLSVSRVSKEEWTFLMQKCID